MDLVTLPEREFKIKIINILMEVWKELFPAFRLLCLSPLPEPVGRAHRYKFLSQSSQIWIPAFHKQPESQSPQVLCLY